VILNLLCGVARDLHLLVTNTDSRCDIVLLATIVVGTPVWLIVAHSFGVAVASLVAALFVPDRFHTGAAQMMHGVHQAFVVLGIATVISSVVGRRRPEPRCRRIANRSERVSRGGPARVCYKVRNPSRRCRTSARNLFSDLVSNITAVTVESALAGRRSNGAPSDGQLRGSI
jgi:hypothetical protein